MILEKILYTRHLLYYRWSEKKNEKKTIENQTQSYGF